MTIEQNQIPSEPSLKDLIDLVKKDVMLTLNAHHIATIQSFDPVKQTATATINYKKTYFKFNQLQGYVPTLVDYPILIDCPVICLGGGLGALTFPIAPGDECLVLFNDRDIDNWFQGTTGSAVASPRAHSFSDGLILVGVRSLPRALSSYNSGAAEFYYGDNRIQIGPTGCKIDLGAAGVSLEIDITGKLKITNGAGEFVAMLVQLFTDIQAGLVTTMLGPQPLNMPTFAADLINLQTFQDV